MTTTDAEVIAASRRDPDHFAILFDRHASHIHHHYVARRAGWQHADDLVAETFLVAFGQRSGYDTITATRPWLYGIATTARDIGRGDSADSECGSGRPACSACRGDRG